MVTKVDKIYIRALACGNDEHVLHAKVRKYGLYLSAMSKWYSCMCSSSLRVLKIRQLSRIPCLCSYKHVLLERDFQSIVACGVGKYLSDSSVHRKVQASNALKS